jgi:predicted nucleotidyltransferase
MNLGAVEEILTQYNHLFIKAYIFGSIVKGTNDEYSDVDLVLVRDTKESFFDRVREVFDLIHELPPTDLLIYTEKEFNEFRDKKSGFFLQKIIGEGVEIEGKQKRSAKMAPAG